MSTDVSALEPTSAPLPPLADLSDFRTVLERIEQRLEALSAGSPLPTLLDRKQLKAWADVSEWWVVEYTKREEDPLPWIGTEKVRRMVPDDFIGWLRRNSDAIQQGS